MQLGFVSAILGDLGLEDVLAFAADEGFGCVESCAGPRAAPTPLRRRHASGRHQPR